MGDMRGLSYLQPILSCLNSIQVYYFHLMIDCCWAHLNLWCGESDRIQLIMSIFEYTVIWYPMVEHSISTRAQKYAKGCFSNTIIPTIDGVALFQNPRNLCCDSPTGACPKFHIASSPTIHMSKTIGLAAASFPSLGHSLLAAFFVMQGITFRTQRGLPGFMLPSFH